MSIEHLALARAVAARFAVLPQVEAVALGGSRGDGGIASDASSDIDVYVYTRGEIPLAVREGIVEALGGATRTSLDERWWGSGDEWLHAPTGIHVDAVYFDAAWMADQVDRVLVRHEASLGYTTCFWHTVRGSIALEDPRGWFAALQARCRIEYPDQLRRNIVALNHPVLRDAIPAYANQLAKAARRGDLVSIIHRLAGLLASYFDILFAVNRVPHPGEKRLVEAALASCPQLPDGFATDVDELVRTATSDVAGLPGRLDGLLDRLDVLLRDEGLVS